MPLVSAADLWETRYGIVMHIACVDAWRTRFHLTRSLRFSRARTSLGLRPGLAGIGEEPCPMTIAAKSAIRSPTPAEMGVRFLGR